MKFADITVGDEYASYSGKDRYYSGFAQRVRPIVADTLSSATAVTKEHYDLAASQPRTYGAPTYKTVDVDGETVYLAIPRSTGWGSMNPTKGYVAQVLDKNSGEPVRDEKGLLRMMFVPSREFRDTWVDHVAKQEAQRVQDEENNRLREQAQADTATERAEIIARIDKAGIPLDDHERTKNYSLGVIQGMSLTQWATVLDAFDRSKSEYAASFLPAKPWEGEKP